MPGPKKNTAFIFDVGLIDRAARPSLKANPTLASGDFKVSIDEGAFNNLATLPTVTPASGVNVKVSLSSSEMNGDRIVVSCIDAAGAEWDDVLVTIVTDSINLTDVDGRLPTALVSGRMDSSVGAYQSGLAPLQPTVAGRTLDVTTTGEAGLDWANIGAPTTVVNLSGTSTKAVEPTVAGRTLDVTATGEAGIDWANIGAPTTAQNLSGTTISTTQVVASVSGAVGSVTGNVGGNVVGSVASVTGSVASVTGSVGSVTGNVGGNVVGSVGSIAANGIASTSFAAGAITGTAFASRAEPGQSTPSASVDPLTKIDWVYKATINKYTETASQFSLFNNAGTVVDHKAAVSDDGTTFTRAGLATGP